MKTYCVRSKRTMISLLLVVLSLFLPSLATAVGESKQSDKLAPRMNGEALSKDDMKDEECKSVGQCEVCSSNDRSREECKPFGKRQKFECSVEGKGK